MYKKIKIVILLIETIIFLPVSPLLWLALRLDDEEMTFKKFYKGYCKMPFEEEK